MELKESGKVIGNIYCGDRDFGAKEVGYIVNRRYQRKGYAREALSAVIGHAFAEGAHRVYAECDPRNAASWRLLESVGLRREAHLRKNIYFRKDESGAPVWKDTFVYAALPGDGAAQAGMDGWIDITRPLEPGMAVYPGDPAFEMDTDEFSIYKVSRIRMSAHCGTHIDAPSHFLLKGDTEDYPMAQLCGEAVLLDWTADWLDRAAGAARVLLRGGNGLSETEARAAAEAGVALIGTDRLSIAPSGAEAAAHRALLSKGVCILENADLSRAPEGTYRLMCFPMKLKGAEGAPVRAFLVDES